MIQPVRDKVVVTVLPQPTTSGLLVRPPTDTPIRRVRVEAVGPDATVTVGRQYLANLLGGQRFADEQVVLPSAPGKSAFYAEWHDADEVQDD